MTLDDTMQEIGGHDCVVMKCRSKIDSELQEWTCFLDPQRNYIPLCLKQQLREHLATEIVIPVVTVDTQHGPVPMEWKTTLYVADGTVVQNYLMVVDKYHLNRTIPDAEFNLTFPEGTRILDGRHKESQFISNALGEIVPATRLGADVPQRTGSYLHIALLLNGVVGLLLAGFVVCRKLRRSYS